MKSAGFFSYALSGAMLLCSTAYSQQHTIDSLKNVLKSEKDDTNKVNTLQTIATSFSHSNNYRQADSALHEALALSIKLNFERGISASYKNLGTVNYTQHIDSEAMKYYMLALKTDETANNKPNMGIDYSYIGLTEAHLGNYIKALKNDSIGLKIQLATNDRKAIYRTYQFIGIAYKKIGDYPKALKNYLLSLKIAEELGDKETAGTDYINIGNIYTEEVNDSEASKSYLLALNYFKEINDKKGMGNAYGSLGNIFYDKKKSKEALYYYTKSLDIAIETGDKAGMSNAYGNIGNIYQDQGNYAEALKNQLLCLSIDKEIGDKEGITEDFMNITGVLTLQKKYRDASIYVNKALDVAKELGSLRLLRGVYGGKATIDSALGDFKTAYVDYQQFIMYRDSLSNAENTKKIISEQMHFEFDKKQAIEKAEQDKKDAVGLAEKRKQSIITISVSLLLLMVMIFSGLLFSRFRLTQKQKKIIERQKGLVEEKNREVLDSITYAKRLQDAILPPLSIIKKHFPESFVLYKPKDIVAGDFYWMESVEGPHGTNTLIAACDCTGHGVPGAMVSVVCSNALNRAIKEFKITETGKILDKVRELVLETFEKSESEVKDGMDISLCSISSEDKKSGFTMQWSGAYNPLWILPGKENEASPVALMKEIAADKQPIGKQDNSKPFTTHTLKLKKGDTFYLFTDGYADQFGGPDGKKYKTRQFQKKLLSLASLSMDKQKEALNDTFENWKGKLEQIDDILIMGIRV